LILQLGDFSQNMRFFRLYENSLKQSRIQISLVSGVNKISDSGKFSGSENLVVLENLMILEKEWLWKR